MWKNCIPNFAGLSIQMLFKGLLVLSLFFFYEAVLSQQTQAGFHQHDSHLLA